MKDEDIDGLLNRASGSPPDVDPELLGRIVNSMGASMRPVRPLPSSGVLVTALTVVCLAVGSVGAAFLGMHGIEAMSAVRIAVIFPVLLMLTALAAAISVSEMIPGSRRILAAWALPALGCLTLTVLFALLFTDYASERFVSQGIACLRAGLVHAIPTAAVAWWVLRRGFAVDSVAAGVAIGTLSGLAGVIMLELHCPNFEVPHLMVWHTAVLAVSGVAGGLIVAITSRYRRRALA